MRKRYRAVYKRADSGGLMGDIGKDFNAFTDNVSNGYKAWSQAPSGTGWGTAWDWARRTIAESPMTSAAAGAGLGAAALGGSAYLANRVFSANQPNPGASNMAYSQGGGSSKWLVPTLAGAAIGLGGVALAKNWDKVVDGAGLIQTYLGMTPEQRATAQKTATWYKNNPSVAKTQQNISKLWNRKWKFSDFVDSYPKQMKRFQWGVRAAKDAYDAASALLSKDSPAFKN